VLGEGVEEVRKSRFGCPVRGDSEKSAVVPLPDSGRSTFQ
jgi:hypothetical protein